MPTPTTDFSEREHQIYLVAQMVEDARTYWVANGGSPIGDDQGSVRGLSAWSSR